MEVQDASKLMERISVIRSLHVYVRTSTSSIDTSIKLHDNHRQYDYIIYIRTR